MRNWPSLEGNVHLLEGLVTGKQKTLVDHASVDRSAQMPSDDIARMSRPLRSFKSRMGDAMAEALRI